jgi:phage shock protein E
MEHRNIVTEKKRDLGYTNIEDEKEKRIKMFESMFNKKRYRDISPEEVKELLDSEKGVLLIDVRTPQEYAEYHIPKSISLPLNLLESGISKITDDKNAEMIVYCLSGRRATAACSRLTEMGYVSVSNMGGIQSWQYQTVSGSR